MFIQNPTSFSVSLPCQSLQSTGRILFLRSEPAFDSIFSHGHFSLFHYFFVLVLVRLFILIFAVRPLFLGDPKDLRSPHLWILFLGSLCFLPVLPSIDPPTHPTNSAYHRWVVHQSARWVVAEPKVGEMIDKANV